MAEGGRAGRAAWRSGVRSRRRCHWGGGGARAEAAGQGADRGHGGRRCATETGHGLGQLVAHLGAKKKRDDHTYIGRLDD